MAQSILPAVRDVTALRDAVRAWRKAGLRVGLVPTMGALHEGHLSLVRAAKERCDRVVASLFVNPRQFAPHEDFERYPRDEGGDSQMLAGAGCDLLFAPERGVMYPEGFATSVIVADVSVPLEGDFRPHFFGGVATVVTKLLLQCLPDVALFGEKDYQQLLVIKKLARDLDIPVEILGCPTVREHDGLAMSSRNAYLSEDERRIAGRLNLILHDAIKAVRHGAPIADAEAEASRHLTAAGFTVVDYVAIRHAETLAPVSDASSARILAAAWLGKTRLIDNMAV
ncbi:pantoate--beta-alanine ligase [Terricaulis silvestris]|uniref:Pantothenate synthetase n=1 Tax=Terricaulis silvestris TaxID=2686094 RepID=A0A6I6MKS4_9CAUL|nr:pantoate--beta-alanine ligase [Terricaulis silvestris]QGZ94611.1 Pantothenate synthetase [Terricaulis silvestris]